MKFPYVRFKIFYKPVVPVIFKFRDKKFPYQALIDTGADISIIHAEIAEQLGISLEDGENFPFGLANVVIIHYNCCRIKQ